MFPDRAVKWGRRESPGLRAAREKRAPAAKRKIRRPKTFWPPTKLTQIFLKRYCIFDSVGIYGLVPILTGLSGQSERLNVIQIDGWKK